MLSSWQEGERGEGRGGGCMKWLRARFQKGGPGWAMLLWSWGKREEKKKEEEGKNRHAAPAASHEKISANSTLWKAIVTWREKKREELAATQVISIFTAPPNSTDNAQLLSLADV